MDAPSTFPALLAARLRSAPAQPLVTAYDEETGERTELSATTYANWVSKTANLLVEELDLEPGDVLLLDLPPHWLVPVFLGAAWTAGVVVTTDPAGAHDAVVCGPDTLPAHTGAGVDGGPEGGRRGPVLACSLRPFAVRFADALPAGVLDHGVLWAGQSDVFVPLDPIDATTPAWREHGPGGSTTTQGDLLARARSTSYAAGVRLLTDVHPAHDAGVPVLLGVLVHEGSLVLVRHPRTDRWPTRHEDERATAELRAAAN
ncbi:MAG: hypothetical protein JWR20_1411 [Marmoricola sp.]|nr:hypothetical protein [Marmoricola sp.]